MTVTLEMDELGLPEYPNGESESSARDTAPNFPYCAVQQLNNVLDRVVQEGPPSTFDSSFFAKTSGSVAAQNRQALRFFDFMDDERRPTGTLRSYVSSSSPEDRLALLRLLFEERYAEALDLAKENGTRQQLESIFRARGLTGATVDKAVSFFLGMCEQLDLPVSPYFKTGRRVSGGAPKMMPTGRSSRRRQKVSAAPQGAVPPESSAAVTGMSLEEQQRAAYVDLLMELVKGKAAAEEPHVQTDLLDRLERAIGVVKSDPPPPRSGG